jgi:hypothetical protein
VVGVEPLGIGIVGGDQLGVGDRLFGGVLFFWTA